MKFKDQIRYSINVLKSEKSQSLLTILGILIGIASIVALTSLSAGYEEKISNDLMGGLNANTIIMRQGSFREEDIGDSVLFYENSSRIEEIEGVETVVPIISNKSTTTFNSISRSVRLTAIPFEKYQNAYSDFIIENGTMPSNPNEIAIGSRLGLMYSQSTQIELNDKIQISFTVDNETKTQNFTVVGICKETNSIDGNGNPADNTIYIDITKVMLISNSTSVSSFTIIANSTEDSTLNFIRSELTLLFPSNVMIMLPTSNIRNSLLESFQTTSAFITSIAAISMVVAGIGIMNITTASLLRRKREIGILKALGVDDSKILILFLIESALFGLIGSLIGILVGYFIAWILGIYFPELIGLGTIRTPFGGGRMPGGGSIQSNVDKTITPVLGFDTAIYVIMFGVLISIIFSLIPAWKAAKADPVKSLKSIE